MNVKLFASRRVALALASVVAGASAAAMPAMAQAPVIVGNQTATATVESVDHEAGMILLRDKAGNLDTVRVDPDLRAKLPVLNPGDKIGLRIVRTIDAAIAPPGSPLPESTENAAGTRTGPHPHGMMVSFKRERVKVTGVDTTRNQVVFVDPDDITRVVLVRQKAMQDFLKTLKPGDEVDTTVMDAVSFSVLSRLPS
ncbi:preprotein translocase subunit YajC [Komagataeibacter sp. AV436]|uniref:Preprotein translocase subunit YajC n=1 Tax=Komagataeibacter melomenusus TaxID=2766578 RepID=A0ABX2AB70_9PROT|nr:preprotein translocase subunit YajC [Komagataeibacter melomenusus]MBV1830173.1 preprotein translocase subunit YajC [Komagataeibacter melomenusus]NPC65520.1 preprotein translocase subunit YajC [Komagataeibacter melomenusus]